MCDDFKFKGQKAITDLQLLGCILPSFPDTMNLKRSFLVSTLAASSQWFQLSVAQQWTLTPEQERNANRTLSVGYVSAARLRSRCFQHQPLTTSKTS